jgi:hypothetical protein
LRVPEQRDRLLVSGVQPGSEFLADLKQMNASS